jgi:hypothetical protein
MSNTGTEKNNAASCPNDAIVSCNSISAFDAKYKRAFDGQNPFTGERMPIPAFEKLASLIDSQWKHSWHWPEDHNKRLDAMRDSLTDEIDSAKRRLDELMIAKSILERIERECS